MIHEVWARFPSWNLLKAKKRYYRVYFASSDHFEYIEAYVFDKQSKDKQRLILEFLGRVAQGRTERKLDE